MACTNEFIACRLPGGIYSPSALWDFLSQKKSAQGPVPEGRFNIKGFYHPDAKSGRAGVIGAEGGYLWIRCNGNFSRWFTSALKMPEYLWRLFQAPRPESMLAISL